MTTPTTAPVVLHTDQEHDGLRIVLFVLLFAAVWLGYQVMLALLRLLAPPTLTDYLVPVACLTGVPLGLGVIWLAEQVLKRFWHSGNSVSLVDDGRNGRVHVQRREGEAQTFDLANHVTVTNWFFRLSGYPRGGRERRAPGKWLCLASELQQDDNRLVVYTFMPPQKAAVWTDTSHRPPPFQQIFPANLYDNSLRSRMGPPSRPEIPAEILRGKSGPLWLAERRRWASGLELTPADFERYMNFVSTHSLNTGQ
jgi:hypothetical protein